jgi:hypothetical protein
MFAFGVKQTSQFQSNTFGRMPASSFNEGRLHLFCETNHPRLDELCKLTVVQRRSLVLCLARYPKKLLASERLPYHPQCAKETCAPQRLRCRTNSSLRKWWRCYVCRKVPECAQEFVCIEKQKFEINQFLVHGGGRSHCRTSLHSSIPC